MRHPLSIDVAAFQAETKQTWVPDQPSSPEQQSDHVGVQLEAGDTGCHGVTLQLGLMDQVLNLRPVDLIGQGTPHNQQGLVHLQSGTSVSEITSEKSKIK